MRPHSPLLAVAFAAIASTTGVPSSAYAQATTTAATPQVVKHTVKTGDTLWDIAKFYLKDPFKWPEVFHANTDIVKNPHWIYPGQVLTIEGAAVRDEVAAQVGPDGFVTPRPAATSSRSTVFLATSAVSTIGHSAVIGTPPTFTVRPGEYEAAPFVADNGQPLNAGKIIGPVERPALGLTSEAGFKLYDRLYVTAPPHSPVTRGDELVLATRRTTIADVGTVIQPTAILHVDSIGGNGILIGTIIRQFHAVQRGELTIPYDNSFSPTTVRPVAGTYPVTSKILWILGTPVLPSLQTYVVLHSAGNQTLHIGDQFTIYERPPLDVRGQVIPTATATVRIVRTTPFAATGMIVDQSQPFVMVGMMARLTAKMM